MNLANALVSKKTDALNLRNTQQNTRLSVLTAISNLKGAIESLALAKTQEDLQHKNYDAEVVKSTPWAPTLTKTSSSPCRIGW